MPRPLANDRPRRKSAAFARALLAVLGAGLLAAGSEAHASPPKDAPVPPAARHDVSAVAPRVGLHAPGVLDPSQGLVGRWMRDLEDRRTQLRREAKGPRGIVALLGVLDSLEGEVPGEELRALLDAASARRGVDPRVASFAQWLHARLDVLGGDRAGARVRLERDGYMLDWSVVGPFDNDGDGGHDTVHPPETTPFERGQTFEGELLGEPLGWRPRTANLNAGGFVALDEVLRPARQATGYAMTEISVPRAGVVLFHVGSSGPYRVWIDGVEIGANDAHRQAHPLQDVHAAWLAQGTHRVLVKASVREGAWGFFLRTSDERGRGLALRPAAPAQGAGDVSMAGPGLVGATRAGAARVRALGPTAKALTRGALRPALAAAVRGDKPRAADLVALADFDRHVRPFSLEDTTDVDLARRASEAAGTAHAAIVLALIERDQNRSRQALDTAIERARAEGKPSAPLLSKALLELAARHEALGQHERARAYVAEARAVQPDDALAELVELDRMARLGLPFTALHGVEDVARRYPDAAIVQEARAQRLEQLGDLQGTAAVLDALAARRPGDVALAARRLALALRRGDLRTARAHVEHLAGLMGDTPQAWQERGRIALAEQDLPTAIMRVDAALELAPQDADLHALRGHLVAMRGDVAGGLISFRRSLALRPQQPGLRDVVAALDPTGGNDFVVEHLLDLEALAKQQVPAAWQGKDSALLGQLVAIHVLPNGLEERVEQRVIRILDERGIRNQAIQATVFDPAESNVEVRRTRVRRADGSVEDLGKARVTSLAEAGFRMFYDQRQLTVEMPGLRVGDVLEVVFVRRDVAARNMFDDYFGDLVALAGLEPRGLVRYVLVAPKSMALHFNLPSDAVQRTDAEDGTTAWVVERNDVAGIKPEGGMPGWTEVVDYLHVSTYATWDDVARWYWRLVEGQLVADAAIQRAVADVLAKLPKDATLEQKVDAIYEHVVRSTRYVGLEFGIHGYKPYRTTEVYERRFGDCKDKASLLKVMLAEAGIESHLVLVRTKDQGRIGETPASLSAFNHAIAYVPALDRYLDGTAEWSGARELPANDQGASVLVVLDGKGGRFTEIPFAPAVENLEVLERDVTLAVDGRAKIVQRARIEGAAAGSHRVRLAAPDTRRERLEQIWSSVFAGATLGDVENVVVDRINEPVSFDLTLEVPNFAQAQTGSLRFFARGSATSYARQLAPQPTRALPLALATTMRDETRTRFSLPPGWRFSHQPEGRTLDSPFGRFELVVKEVEGGVQVDTTLELSDVRIDPVEYKSFREFLRGVDAALAQTFEAEPAR